MYSVYILYSSSTNQFYKGQTAKLADRIKRHNGGYENFTKTGIPWKLIWATQKESRSQAKQLERKLKNLSQEQTLKFVLKYDDGIVGPEELLLVKQLSGC